MDMLTDRSRKPLLPMSLLIRLSISVFLIGTSSCVESSGHRPMSDSNSGSTLPGSGQPVGAHEQLDVNLPAQDKLRKIAELRIKDKSLEELVSEIGADPWLAHDVFSNLGAYPTSLFGLSSSFEHNLRLKLLIQLGRHDPEMIGSIISSDLKKRASNWFDTVDACERAYHEDGQAGYVVDHTGKVSGSSAFHKYCQDQYGMPADMFVLMNIDYDKSLDALIDYAYWRYKVEVEIVDSPYGPGPMVKYIDPPRPPYGGQSYTERLNHDMLFYAAAYYLTKSNNPKYEEARNHLEKFLDGRPLYKEITTDAPEALWPQDHPFLGLYNVDSSSEPKMTLCMPNLQLFGQIHDWWFGGFVTITELVKVEYPDAHLIDTCRERYLPGFSP